VVLEDNVDLAAVIPRDEGARQSRVQVAPLEVLLLDLLQCFSNKVHGSLLDRSLYG
jgi:hypothetical protein